MEGNSDTTQCKTEETSEVSRKRKIRMTRNPYLNFCAEIRQKHNSRKNAADMMKEAAAAWQSLPEEQKQVYSEQASKVRRRRRNRLTRKKQHKGQK